MFQATIDCLLEFAKLNKSEEVFYAFAFDRKIQQGHFGICLNNLKHFKRQFDLMQIHRASITTINVTELKYNPGNWKYQVLNLLNFKTISDIWQLVVGLKIDYVYSILEELEYNEILDSDTIEDYYNSVITGFNKSVDKVRIRTGDLFRNLRITNDFKIYRLIIDEDILNAINRI